LLGLLVPELCLRAEDAEAYTCGICFLMLRDPMIMNNGGDQYGYRNCGHGPYCSTCLLKAFKKSGSHCPDCRQPTDVDQLVYDARTARLLRSVKVRCAHHGEGCSWEGEVRDWDQHVMGCALGLLSPDAPPAAAESPAPTERMEHPFGLNAPLTLPASRPWSANDAYAAPARSRPATASRQALTDRPPGSASGERAGRPRSRGSSQGSLAVSRSRSPHAAESQWRPIDLSAAIALLPEDLRPPSPLLSIRSSASSVSMSPDASRMSPALALPPHMVSLFARLATPEDMPKLAEMSHSARRQALVDAGR
jgi:hypothetical protein